MVELFLILGANKFVEVNERTAENSISLPKKTVEFSQNKKIKAKDSNYNFRR